MAVEFSARLVEDEMSKVVVTALPEYSVNRAISSMQKHRVTVLPVLDEQGKCVGMFSASDLVRREPGESTVGDLMETRVAAVRTTSSIVEATGEMLRHRVHHLPVLDEDQKLVGILASMDVLAALYKSQGDGRCS